MNSTVISPHQALLFTFPVHHANPKSKFKTKLKTTRFGNFSFSVKSFSLSKTSCSLRIVQSSVINKIEPQQRIIPPNFDQCNDKNAFDIAKPVVYALFYIVLGLFCPVSGFRKPAFAAVATPSAVLRGLFGRKTKGEEKTEKGHKYSHCTRKLLEIVARLLKTIEEAKSSGQQNFENVQDALKEVKTTKKALQDEIMNGLYAEMRVLNREKAELMKSSEGIEDKIMNAKREEERLTRKARGGDERIERLQEEMRQWESEYNGIWERIGEIEDLITKNETLALSIGVRELLFIERECEALVEGFFQETRLQNIQR